MKSDFLYAIVRGDIWISATLDESAISRTTNLGVVVHGVVGSAQEAELVANDAAAQIGAPVTTFKIIEFKQTRVIGLPISESSRIEKCIHDLAGIARIAPNFKDAIGEAIELLSTPTERPTAGESEPR